MSQNVLEDSEAGPLPPWWEEWAGRLEAEIAQFGVRSMPVEVLEDPRGDAKRLVLQTVLALGEREVRLKVIYPDAFPFLRFRVESQDLSLSRHQAPGGDLCVLGRGAQFWDSEMLGADIVADQVPLLVGLVERGGDQLRSAEDPQGEPFTVYYPYHHRGAILLDARFPDLRLDEGRRGAFVLATTQPPAWMDPMAGDVESLDDISTGQAWVLKLTDEHGADLVPELKGSSRDAATRVSGMWVRLGRFPEEMSAEGLWDAVVSAGAPETQAWLDRRSGRVAVALCADEETQQDVFEPAWVFLVRHVKTVKTKGPRGGSRQSGNPAAPARSWTEPQVIRALRVDDRSMGVRIPQSAPLRTKAVAVLGLGSIGAPVAQELVKARVGTLRMMDGDYLDPATSVRHPLGVGYAGVHKAVAMAKWIQQHDAGIEVHSSVHVVGSPGADAEQQSDRDAMRWLLTGVDLVVGATAEHDVNRYLDHIALHQGVPRLYAWSQSGYGGIVAMLTDGKTGCFHCLELLLQDRAAAGTPLVQVPASTDGRPVGEVQGVGCAAKTFTALHTDLLPISIQAARVAHDFLAPSSGAAATNHADVWAVQVLDAAGRATAPQWTSYPLPPDSRCSTCS